MLILKFLDNLFVATKIFYFICLLQGKSQLKCGQKIHKVSAIIGHQYVKNKSTSKFAGETPSSTFYTWALQ